MKLCFIFRSCILTHTHTHNDPCMLSKHFCFCYVCSERTLPLFSLLPLLYFSLSLCQKEQKGSYGLRPATLVAGFSQLGMPPPPPHTWYSLPTPRLSMMQTTHPFTQSLPPAPSPQEYICVFDILFSSLCHQHNHPPPPTQLSPPQQPTKKQSNRLLPAAPHLTFSPNRLA